MRHRSGWMVALVLAALAAPMGLTRADDKDKGGEPAGKAAAKAVPFPTAYRTFTHVKSMVIYSKKHPLFDAFGGIHHIYVNEPALKALKSTRTFPTGSIFVFDLREAADASGAYTEGKRKFVAVMHRDAKKYADTEGWGWQAWEGGDPSKPVLKGLSDQKACATCHKEVGAKGFVFTEWTP